MNVWKGHEVAVENFRTLTEWCRNSGRVSVLTVWCFSTENWKRPKAEISALMNMLEEYLLKERDGFQEKHTRFVHSGRRDRIPESLKKAIEETEDMTKGESGFTLHLAVDYGGMDEVARGVRRMQDAGNATEASVRAALDHPELPDIDVILRSSGEHRTSNFFLFQAAYAEWVFNPKFFPEIGTSDLESALNEYERRKRRFGS